MIPYLAEQAMHGGSYQSLTPEAYRQETLSGIDEILDEQTQEYYLARLDKIEQLKLNMGQSAYRDAEYYTSEHKTSLNKAESQAAAVRPYLASRGLVETY